MDALVDDTSTLRRNGESNDITVESDGKMDWDAIFGVLYNENIRYIKNGYLLSPDQLP
jgi:hypothetical protein